MGIFNWVFYWICVCLLCVRWWGGGVVVSGSCEVRGWGGAWFYYILFEDFSWF